MPFLKNCSTSDKQIKLVARLKVRKNRVALGLSEVKLLRLEGRLGLRVKAIN